MCHVNLLKPFYGSEDAGDPKINIEDKVDASDSCIKPVLLADPFAGDDDAGSSTASIVISGDHEEIDPGDSILQGRLHNSEALNSLHDRFSHLSEVQCTDLINLIFEYVTLFPDTPSRTSLIEHDIDVGDSVPIRQRYY